MRREDRHDRQRSNDLTVRPTFRLTPVRRPLPSLVLPRRRGTRCRARLRCEPSGGSASWPGGRRCNQAGDQSQWRRLKALLDHLYNEGCSIISTGTCTFSTPMTEAEIDTLVGAFKSGFTKLAAMR